MKKPFIISAINEIKRCNVHIHILGICGTFMGGLALIAKQQGHQVSGSDLQVYPPMSTQLTEQGIQLMEGYHPENLDDKPDLVIIGNALSRGNAEVEAVLNRGLKYTSGAQWLAESVLQDKWVLAVAGTHGKTTTSSMLAWILEVQGFEAGFLIGGIPLNFGLSARLGRSDFFVIEADEYDTAFFDKRSKFVHYRPRTAILNNLEFDHADIFDDLAAIQRQFHHLVRTIPSEGLIISPQSESALAETLEMGCWTPVAKTAINDSNILWNAQLTNEEGSEFFVEEAGKNQGTLSWSLTGLHNVNNALAAIAAAKHIGILPSASITALNTFKSVKRRMEVIIKTDTLTVYDDFAHHPTAIASTLAGLRKQVGSQQITAVVEPRSNTMRLGIHNDTLADSLKDANQTIIYQADDMRWNLQQLTESMNTIEIYSCLDDIVEKLKQLAGLGGHIVLMSNGSFDGLYQRLETALST